MKGKFIPLLIPFQKSGQFIAAETQALQILSEAEKLRAEGKCLKIGITYSANYDQTKSINRCYNEGKAITGVGGANQAEVMNALEKLLDKKYIHLQNSFRIVPITTMTYSGYDGCSHKEIVMNDLKALQALLEDGWCIFGWMNQHTAPEFAIGGGIAALPDELKTLIQENLKNLKENYS